MIVSVSRRTDIPAFYSDWFYNRIKEGFAYVENPMNPKQVSKILLNPETVDCFVFWTKNAGPMLKRLDELKMFKYYFQYTITGYRRDVERGITDKKEVIRAFKELSNVIGKDKVILRYDPIFISDKYSIDYHLKAFATLLKQLEGYTERCVISFIDFYKKTERNTKELKIQNTRLEDIRRLAKGFSIIAKEHNISLETCSEAYDLTEFDIKKGSCIDGELVSKIIGYEINVRKDDTQREICGCVKSVDIGQYHTCRHHCLYCYANYNHSVVEENYKLHDKNYPLLIGKVRNDAKITEREMKSVKGKKLWEEQLDFLNILEK